MEPNLGILLLLNLLGLLRTGCQDCSRGLKRRPRDRPGPGFSRVWVRPDAPDDTTTTVRRIRCVDRLRTQPFMCSWLTGDQLPSPNAVNAESGLGSAQGNDPEWITRAGFETQKLELLD